MPTLTNPGVVGTRTPSNDDPIARSAGRLYDAETALHAARQTHIDTWITAANDRLHEAYEAYWSAVSLRAG